MILERAAAYVLAVACIFQALHPSWAIRPPCWQNIDIQMRWLRVHAINGADLVCFDGVAGKKEAAGCSSKRRIPQLPKRPRNLKGLSICMAHSGCMTTWLDENSHGWSVSKGMEDDFEKSLNGFSGRDSLPQQRELTPANAAGFVAYAIVVFVLRGTTLSIRSSLFSAIAFHVSQIIC